jgi:hypothetical protein
MFVTTHRHPSRHWNRSPRDGESLSLWLGGSDDTARPFTPGTPYPDVVFGWRKTPVLSAETLQESAKSSGKGRPTPKRKEAERRNRMPLGSGRTATVRPDASKAERKAAKEAQRQAAQEERMRTREALYTGDEAHLPARDKGPARRFARDYVDARRGIGEYFLPLAIAILLISLVPIPVVQQVGMMTIWTAGLLAFGDAILLRGRVNRLARDRFGAEAASGVGFYAMMRSLQVRRTRLPRPQVKRGEFPS